ncbi:DMT family transporter [Alteromonas naphthalenivorans]|jgi:drug/metabolite transporter (DMT)-like permease|uniref:Membrane protein n=2 Tax=Alteromonas TaxID=226 RepID=F5Z557_ALTNA|nr:DMT family transporter [Alteromonas naphthalenivorans]AEF04703.1 membrane protein [Alteromonas naphthalenivorans]|tara:strand:+ start:1845 stop:2729 length:885 start_codon:yes stop_codon:yes gene_type:complete
MNAVKRSLISLHFTVVLLGGTALFSHLVPLSASDITLMRSVFACIALFLFLRFSSESLTLASRKDYLIAIGLGILMALHWVTYFAAMQYSSVSVGMIALFTFPVITVLIEPFFEKVSLVWQDIVSALTVIAGVYFIVPETSLDNDITLGVLIGVGSAVLYAFRNLIHRKHFKQYSGAKAMAWQTLVIAIFLLPTGSNEITDAPMSAWLMLLLLGTVFTALPHALIAASLRHLRAKTFSLIACMQPFYGVILAVLLLDENPSGNTLLGGILITSASIYETLNTHKLHGKSEKDSD